MARLLSFGTPTKKKTAIKVNRQDNEPSFGKPEDKIEQRNGDKQKLFIEILRGKCVKLGIPESVQTIQSAANFYNEVLEKLDFLNEQMMAVYSQALCYRSSESHKKTDFCVGLNRKIFETALAEIDDWKAKAVDYEVPVILNSDVCNLYCMRDSN